MIFRSFQGRPKFTANGARVKRVESQTSILVDFVRVARYLASRQES